MTTTYGEPRPLDSQSKLDLSFSGVSTVGGLDGEITAMTLNNSFRTGQQLFLCVGLQLNTADDGNYITQVRLKPWWARAAQEKRQAFGGNGTVSGAPGVAQGIPLDRQVFGDGPLADPLQNNRYVWIPSPKYIDVTQFQTPPPPAAPPRNSYSLFVDDVWVWDLPDPATVAANFGADQDPARWQQFEYPAYGYALGFTAEADFVNPDGDDVPLRVSLSWQQLATNRPKRSANVSLP